jgi:hypothetical protein
MGAGWNRLIQAPHRLQPAALEHVPVKILGEPGRAVPDLVGDVADVGALGDQE